MRILITGGAGFIGSHLCDRLLRDGHTVTVLDDLSTGYLSNLKQASQSDNFSFIQGSVLDSELVEKSMQDQDYVFHFAAAVGVFNIVNRPLQSLLTNVRGTEIVLESADKFSLPVLITSSSEVYGKNISDSLLESNDRILGSPLTLRWSYSEAKAIDESLAFAYFMEKGLQTRIVRFFNTVGPRQVGAYGMVVPRFVRAALSNEPLTIFGDGQQTRCFAHVHDVVEAVIAIAFSDKTIGLAINIGNNFEISILDLAKKIILEVSSNSDLEFLPYSEAYGAGFEDMQRRVPSIELVKNLVGWVPKRDLTAIISDISKEMRT